MTESEQWAFWSTMNYDVVRRLSENEMRHDAQMKSVQETLDKLLARTTAIEMNLHGNPSSLQKVGASNNWDAGAVSAQQIITGDGYASVEPARAQTVHGVLWRITPRDRVMLDTWENVGGGLYRAEVLAVRRKRCLAPALIYFARPGAEGRPKPGYIELVLAAAREWDLPAAYIHWLEGFASARPLGPDARKIGEFR